MENLAFFVALLTDVPEEHRALYAPTTFTLAGKEEKGFALKIKGAVDIRRFQEFRDKNIQLLKDQEAYTALGKTPEELKALAEKADDLADEKLVKKEKLDEVRNAATEKLTKEWQKKETAWNTERAALQTKLENLMINEACAAEAVAIGFRPESAEELSMMARTLFKVENGVLKAYGKDGKEIFDAEDPTKPKGMKQWLGEIAKAKPYLLAENDGGGAGGSDHEQQRGNGGTQFKDNPWHPDTFNRTQQDLIEEKHPELAKRYKSEASRVQSKTKK